LRLAYGRDDLAPPRYDLALLAPHVLGLSAREVTAAPEAELPGRTPSLLISRRMFWLLLAASVVVLLAIIGRLILKS
jgi:hypothetical protein